MTFHQVMYRRYPKKQDHGTKGYGRRKYTYRRWYNRVVAAVRSDARKRWRTANRVELNKLYIDCADEDIERYILKSRPSSVRGWFD